MKFLVLGAGLMGYAVIYDLIRSPGVEKIFLADINGERLQKVVDKLPDPRIIPCLVNVSDINEVSKLMSGANVAISCVNYKYNYELAKAALGTGTNFVDLGGNTEIVAKEFLLDEFAKERKIAIIPDCGLAPGLVSILTAAAVDNLDEIYEIRIRVGGLPIEPKPPLNYTLSFSVEGLINEYYEPATIIREGKTLLVPSLEDVEEIEFPKPFGKMEAFNTSGGISTLPATFAGKVQYLDYKTIRYPGHCAQIRLLQNLGLLSTEPVTLGNTKVIPRELLTNLLYDKLTKEESDVILLRITITGMRDKKPVRVRWEAIDYMDQAEGLSAMMRMTAFPASIVAQMIAKGDIKDCGTLSQELSISPKLFLAELAARGIRLTMEEQIPPED